MSSFQNLAIADQVRNDDGLVALRQTQLFTPGFPYYVQERRQTSSIMLSQYIYPISFAIFFLHFLEIRNQLLAYGLPLRQLNLQ